MGRQTQTERFAGTAEHRSRELQSSTGVSPYPQILVLNQAAAHPQQRGSGRTWAPCQASPPQEVACCCRQSAARNQAQESTRSGLQWPWHGATVQHSLLKVSQNPCNLPQAWKGPQHSSPLPEEEACGAVGDQGPRRVCVSICPAAGHYLGWEIIFGWRENKLSGMNRC